MKRNPNKLWIPVFALGWFFDFLFWEKEPGINFAIFAMAGVTAAFYLLLSNGLRPNRTSLSLLPLFGFFAAVTFIRAEPMTIFLAYTFTMFTMSLLALTYLGGRWYLYTWMDYIAKYFSLLGSLTIRPISFMAEARKEQKEAGIASSRRIIWPILRGIILALPVIAIFASLLASADAVFNQRLEDFIQLFRLEDLPEYIFRMIYILALGYALAGVVLHASTESADQTVGGKDRPGVPQFLGFLESAIVLGSVVILFAAFVAIQFQYFFGGTTNIHLDGYTYAEYARRGFGELVTVAFFALLMLLIFSAITRRESELQRKVYSGLGVALVALLLVMLVSAYQRLSLYEAAYGFSRLRTYTHVFLIWIGLLLIAIMALEILRQERLFAAAMLAAALGFAISLPILNVDVFIVRQNIQRELNNAAPDMVDLDAQYFIDLSDDAVPTLTQTLQSTAAPDPVREKIGAALACIQGEREQENRRNSWQSFHFARHQADQALASVKQQLDEYILDDREYPVMVTTPSGTEYPCSEYFID